MESHNREIRREFRFYACLLLGASLIFLGCLLPPLGVVHNSILIGSGMFLCVGSMAIGVDIKGCLEELVKLKKDG
jgi:hypothetical protein